MELSPQDHKHAEGDNRQAVIPDHAARTQKGVAEVEAVNAIWNKTSKAFLLFGVACIAYIYSLDGTTTYQYAVFATSSFSLHSALATVAVMQAIILAVSQPIAAKIADVFGRAEAFIVAVILYVVGYIVVASSSGITSYAAGSVIYYMGYASIQILIQIVIADITTLRWRTLVSSLVSAPFFINAFVSANIAAGILPHWRWGYGMFAIIIPVGAAPIIGTLLWAQHKAKKLGVLATVYNGRDVAVNTHERKSTLSRFAQSMIEIDVIGLLLIGFALALILVPLTITNRGTNSWNSASVIAMLVCGFVILGLTIVYEGWFAKYPAVPGRFMRNPTVLAACIIGMFDFISFYLQFTYQYSFIYITRLGEWSQVDLGYFANTQSLALTLFAILAGFYILLFKRLKVLLVVGLAIRLLGVGLMIRARGANGTTAELVIVQIIQGAGGGIAAGATQTAAQGVVPHQDLSAVTAVVLLFAEVGGAIGTAIAGAIWRNTMPQQLAKNLSGQLDQTAIDTIFGSITVAIADYPRGTAAYQGIVAAYTQVMEWILIPATCFAVIPLIAAFFVKNLVLGNVRNVVEEEDAVSFADSDKKHGY